MMGIIMTLNIFKGFFWYSAVLIYNSLKTSLQKSSIGPKRRFLYFKIVSEYDQKIPQSQTADNPVAPQGRAAQPSRDTRKTNLVKQPALSSSSRWLQY